MFVLGWKPLCGQPSVIHTDQQHPEPLFVSFVRLEGQTLSTLRFVLSTSAALVLPLDAVDDARIRVNYCAVGQLGRSGVDAHSEPLITEYPAERVVVRFVLTRMYIIQIRTAHIGQEKKKHTYPEHSPGVQNGIHASFESHLLLLLLSGHNDRTVS